MTLQRLVIWVAVAFVALWVVGAIASYTLWSSGDDPPRPVGVELPG